MELKDKLNKFASLLNNVGHIWVIVEIIKTLLEIGSFLNGADSINLLFPYIKENVIELIIILYESAMSIVIVHLVFEFGEHLMLALAAIVEKKK